jgi:lipoate-protein ligase A
VSDVTEGPEGFGGRRKISEILSDDEAMLRRAAPASRVTVISDRGVSLGVSQSLDAPAAVRARDAGLPVAQRSSGGTGMLHLPGDIAWSIVLPRSHPAARGPTHAYARLGAPVTTVLDELGVPSVWRASSGLSGQLCLLGARGDALYSGTSVLGGAAQHVTGSALLHHGILNLRIDRPLLANLFQLATEASRSFTCLRDLGVALPAEEVAIRLAVALPRSLAAP